MNIVICDDEAVYRKSIHDNILDWDSRNDHAGSVSVREFASSEDLLEAWANGFRADLLILDIKMPQELSGLEVARKIRNMDSDVLIAFITNYVDYACEGYEVDAVRYILKPVKQESVFECLDMSWKRCRMFHADSLTVQSGGCAFRVSPRRITYIEVRGHVVTIHMSDRESAQTYGNLAEILRKLPSEMISQCHKSYAVNVMYISMMRPDGITLTDGAVIPMGRKYISQIASMFNRLFLGGEVR